MFFFYPVTDRECDVSGNDLYVSEYCQRKQYSLNDLMYFYRNHPDRVITASFVFAVINLLTMLPSTIYSYTAQVDVNDINALADSVVRSASMLIIGLLVYEVLVIPMEMAYFILSDHPR